MIFSTNITLTVDVKLLIRPSFDNLKIIGRAKTGPAGPLPTAMDRQNGRQYMSIPVY